ncbi:sensor histidine kinase [Kineosporia sp. A_224]|uniref:sensor histidine kinase n=1 Tax=Kineosporia sp. A_224 TaxID=1962180 RepID=UPI000B4BAF9A|nr:sensor histidine kinase [Kineosporia sp. A_224]
MPRLRVDSVYVPLFVRAALIGLCGLATTFVDGLGPRGAIVPTLLLLLIAGLASIPLPEGLPRAVQALAEGIGAAIIVGALAGKADLFLPYLLVPLVIAGLGAGVFAALGVAVSASLVLLLVSQLATTPVETRTALTPSLLVWWIPLFLAVGLVSAWVRRVVFPYTDSPEPAYADAHRLLSELHVVARQLSLGLDPQTLAAALVDETAREVPGSSGTVLVKSPAGRFVPILGEHPTSFAEAVVLDAWVAADAVRRARDGVCCAALPVLMGERVVAVLVLSGRETFHDGQLESARRRVAAAGPRLASALLFDDVRRLATDDERVRLAREIHDGIAQDMASVGYLVDDIARDATPDVASRLVKLREHIGGLVGELRLSIFDLRAGVDEKVGLSRTLADYVQRVGGQAGLVVHVSTDESSSRLPVAVEVEILRIVQEAVTNVRKHAQATNLWLSVVVDPPRAKITVTDDGCGFQDRHTGFTPVQGIRMGGMGVTGMHERARRIGARLSVGDRTEGSGTVVELIIDPEIALRRARARGKIPNEARTVTDSQATDQVVVTADAGARGESSLARLLRNLPRNGEVNRGR